MALIVQAQSAGPRTDDLRARVTEYNSVTRFEASANAWHNTPANASPNMSATFSVADLLALVEAAREGGFDSVKLTLWARTRRAPATSAPAEQASE